MDVRIMLSPLRPTIVVWKKHDGTICVTLYIMQHYFSNVYVIENIGYID